MLEFKIGLFGGLLRNEYIENWVFNGNSDYLFGNGFGDGEHDRN
jgi:hypothetical protein